MESQPALEIEFTAKPKGAEGSSAKIVVNKGEMYRVMATIVDIIKKYLKKSKAQAIIYSPSKKSSEENFGAQRDNLYRAFISKAIPGVTFKQSGDFVTAILPSVKEASDPQAGTALPYGSGFAPVKENDQELDKQINTILQDWIISSLDDKEKRSFTLQKLLQLDIPEEYKQVPSNTMFRIIRAEPGLTKIKLDKTPYSSYAYDYKGVKKILSWYKKDYNDKLTSYLVEISVKDVIISIPTFYKKTKIWNGKYFDRLWRTEYEVIAKNPSGEYEVEILQELVTATEVICDNCGWEWKIADGGKDLYICHKCGHDNTPNPNDPFGLNELARQFIKEALIETWNPEESFVSLSRYMIANGMNIKPLPKIKVIKDDEQNASDLLGKTAYYNPTEKSITLYTMDRHPKDILRSFAHEMVHHEQNLDGRLGNINTTNTNEDGDLPEIEREAYEKGNMMLRNWEDKIKNV
jgi:hypothetical protein